MRTVRSSIPSVLDHGTCLGRWTSRVLPMFLAPRRQARRASIFLVIALAALQPGCRPDDRVTDQSRLAQPRDGVTSSEWIRYESLRSVAGEVAFVVERCNWSRTLRGIGPTGAKYDEKPIETDIYIAQYRMTGELLRTVHAVDAPQERDAAVTYDAIPGKDPVILRVQYARDRKRLASGPIRDGRFRPDAERDLAPQDGCRIAENGEYIAQVSDDAIRILATRGLTEVSSLSAAALSAWKKGAQVQEIVSVIPGSERGLFWVHYGTEAGTEHIAAFRPDSEIPTGSLDLGGSGYWVAAVHAGRSGSSALVAIPRVFPGKIKRLMTNAALDLFANDLVVVKDGLPSVRIAFSEAGDRRPHDTRGLIWLEEDARILAMQFDPPYLAHQRLANILYDPAGLQLKQIHLAPP